MNILGIESSCDETAAAIVTSEKRILSNIVLSQNDEHAPFGGVVPEIAARSHIENMDWVVQQAIHKSGLNWQDIDAIAATTGPGLIGGVLVGTMTGKALSSILKKPFIAINHLEGHALTARLCSDIEFPYLLLLVSGGHCQVMVVEGVGKYQKLGSTLDDALGEAFDKTAKMLGLGYPGGPKIEENALRGNPDKFKFPLPLKGREGCDFSFSGLKTAIRLIVQDIPKTPENIADICASFQQTAGEILKDRISNAINMFSSKYDSKKMVVAGGVAANKYLRNILEELTNEFGFSLFAPPINLCTDNAAMIAWVGVERFQLGITDSLETEPRARWAL